MRQREFVGKRKKEKKAKQQRKKNPSFYFADKCYFMMWMCAIFLWLLNWFLDLFLYLLPETFLIS